MHIISQVSQKLGFIGEKILELGLRDQLDDLTTTLADDDNANSYVPGSVTSIHNRSKSFH